MTTFFRRLAAGLLALTAVVAPSIGLPRITSPTITAPSAEVAVSWNSITSPSIVAPSAEVAVSWNSSGPTPPPPGVSWNS